MIKTAGIKLTTPCFDSHVVAAGWEVAAQPQDGSAGHTVVSRIDVPSKVGILACLKRESAGSTPACRKLGIPQVRSRGLPDHP